MDNESQSRRPGRPRKAPERLLRTVNLRLPQGMLEDIERIHSERQDDDLADVLRDLLRVGIAEAKAKPPR